MIRRTCCSLFLINVFVLINSASYTKEISEDEIHDNPLYTDNFEEIKPSIEEQILKQDKHFWFHQGTSYLKHALMSEAVPVPKVAKNVIFFLADGMGATTTTAARIYKGQRMGKSGEEHVLSFEEFQNIALVKTYDVDMQVPDSASTATALFTGVKSRYKTLGLDATTKLGQFTNDIYVGSKLNSFMVWAQEAEKATGIVTTTRITHATPAATYSRISHRDWECDSFIPEKYKNELKDIARQLVEDSPGKNFNVILGGGQEQLGYIKMKEKSVCPRGDNLNLTKHWLNEHRDNAKTAFVVDKKQLIEAAQSADFLMGLFSPSHLPYEANRKKNFPNVPSLTDMTDAALKVLKKNSNGFVLMVEAGLIDRAHHQNFARFAMEETSELDNAVALALKETGPETLVIVTSDHSHSFSLNGYPNRGNDILGTANDTVPYLTLSYTNGPGFKYHYNSKETVEGFPWRNLSVDDARLKDPFYQHPATFYRYEDTHGGEDVPIYAKGPGAHLVRGVIEQNYVAHVISYAACIGPHARLNEHCRYVLSKASSNNKFNYLLLILTFLLYGYS